jgi:hypothetical protein
MTDWEILLKDLKVDAFRTLTIEPGRYSFKFSEPMSFNSRVELSYYTVEVLPLDEYPELEPRDE